MGYVILTKINNADVAVGKLTNCGCLDIDNGYKETKIPPIPRKPTLKLTIPSNSNNEIQELKDKVICEFLEIIKQLECGIQPNLEFLLEEISLIDIYQYE